MSEYRQFVAYCLLIQVFMFVGDDIHGEEAVFSPIVYYTDRGTIAIPREYAPIDIWKTMEIEGIESNYFIFRIPIEEILGQSEDSGDPINPSRDDVIVTVDASSDRGGGMVRSEINRCASLAYNLKQKVCIFRYSILNNKFKIKFLLLDEDKGLADSVSKTVGVLIDSPKFWSNRR